MRHAWLIVAASTMTTAFAMTAAPAQTAISALRPPDPATLMATYKAAGVQIYGCSAAEHWTLTSPDAVLTDARGAAVIHHFAGPTWQARDGSKVLGTLVAKAAAPVAGAIPWLLLSSVETGAGILAGARFVVRRDTEGGVAPMGPCAAGQGLRVPYTAVYAFYR